MDQAFLKLVSERQDDLEDLYAHLTSFKDELRKKVRELGSLVEVEKHGNVRQFFWRERAGMYDLLCHDIRLSKDLLVTIDTVIAAKGWTIYIWPRRGDHRLLREVLQQLAISVEERNKKKRFVHTTRFPYSENLNNISPVIQDLVDTLAASRSGRR